MSSHRLTTIESGNALNGTIVAFHGVTDNAASLSDLAQHWKSNWRVILVDALGHGTSDRFSLDELADPFEALVQAAMSTVAGIQRTSAHQRIVLYGHSLGGAIAVALALRTPENISALILEDPALLTHEQYTLYHAEGPALAKRQRLISAHPGKAIIELMKTHPHWPVSEYGAWAQGKTQVDVDFVRTGVVGLLGRHYLSHLTMPTLLVTGQNDDVLFGQSGIDEVSAYNNPHIHTALIPSTTHTVRRDNATAFYAVADTFLDTLKPQPPAHFYCRPELLPIINATPEQTTWDPQAMRARAEELLTSTAPLPAHIRVETLPLPSPSSSPISTTSSSDTFSSSVRILSSSTTSPERIIMAVHGGGYIAGQAAYDDQRNAEFVDAFGSSIIYAPNYRLAPEHPFPAAVNDCLASLDLIRQRHPQLPIFLYGDSAGAGLCTQMIPRLSAEQRAPITGFICLEPCIDPTASTPSYTVHADAPIWNQRAAHNAWKHYLGGQPPALVHPPVTQRASLFPPTLIIANPVDPLRDEAIQFATDIIDGGGIAELHILAGTFHGALSVPQTHTWEQVKTLIRTFLHSTPTR